MKFSDIEKEAWNELKPYLDTCLLPLSGLKSTEEPWEVTVLLEKLRDLMDCVEIPFKGRVVTYPAVHYFGEKEAFSFYVNEICKQLKQSGFVYVVLITPSEEIGRIAFQDADLMIDPDMAAAKPGTAVHTCVSKAIRQMWEKENVTKS